jgi:hypothetical protein
LEASKKVSKQENTKDVKKMGRIIAIGSALGRSLEMLKNSRAVSQFITPQGIPTIPLSAAVAPTRGYVSATDLAHVLDSFTRKSNLRANLSHGLPLHSNITTARFFSSVTVKVENLVQSNKVREHKMRFRHKPEFWSIFFLNQKNVTRTIFDLLQTLIICFIPPSGRCFLEVILSFL